jgi:hypothetical protein
MAQISLLTSQRHEQEVMQHFRGLFFYIPTTNPSSATVWHTGTMMSLTALMTERIMRDINTANPGRSDAGE